MTQILVINFLGLTLQFSILAIGVGLVSRDHIVRIQMMLRVRRRDLSIS